MKIIKYTANICCADNGNELSSLKLSVEYVIFELYMCLWLLYVF